MIKELNLNYDDIDSICETLKHIPFDKVKKEWDILKKISIEEISNLNGRSKVGCNFIDYYFFKERIVTKGNKGINFFEFLRDLEYYSTKKYIKTLVEFSKKNNRYKDNIYKFYYYIYGLCFGRINAFKITNAQFIYKKYSSQKILDPFCGFGGRMVAAMLENIEYVGIDKNTHLEAPYSRLTADFSQNTLHPPKILFDDSSTFDFEEFSKTYDYDMVFTSPPYKNIEIYRNSEKKTDEEWNSIYKKVFVNTWKQLKVGGWFIININQDIYKTCLIETIGECHEKYLLKKTKKNSYDEYVYVWKKLGE